MEIFRAFMQQASGQGARSTALHPIIISLGTFLSALLISVYVNADQWVRLILASLVLANSGVLMFSYLFLLFRDRDALRSERFTLSKLAIEKSLTGDSISGFRLIDGSPESTRLLSSEETSTEGGSA